MSAAERSRRWRLAHPEYKATRKPLTAEQRERKLRKQRAWRRRNADHIREYHVRNRRVRNAKRRAWYAANAAVEVARTKAWKAAHPEAVREYERAHKASYRVRLAIRKFTQTLAQNRLALKHIERRV
jgi:hypothetical protein